MVLSPSMFKALQWRGVAATTPMILLWGGGAFFGTCCLFQHLYGSIYAAGGAAAASATPAILAAANSWLQVTSWSCLVACRLMQTRLLPLLVGVLRLARDKTHTGSEGIRGVCCTGSGWRRCTGEGALHESRIWAIPSTSLFVPLALVLWLVSHHVWLLGLRPDLLDQSKALAFEKCSHEKFHCMSNSHLMPVGGERVLPWTVVLKLFEFLSDAQEPQVP